MGCEVVCLLEAAWRIAVVRRLTLAGAYVRLPTRRSNYWGHGPERLHAVTARRLWYEARSNGLMFRRDCRGMQLPNCQLRFLCRVLGLFRFDKPRHPTGLREQGCSRNGATNFGAF